MWMWKKARQSPIWTLEIFAFFASHWLARSLDAFILQIEVQLSFFEGAHKIFQVLLFTFFLLHNFIHIFSAHFIHDWPTTWAIISHLLFSTARDQSNSQQHRWHSSKRCVDLLPMMLCLHSVERDGTRPQRLLCDCEVGEETLDDVSFSLSLFVTRLALLYATKHIVCALQ